MILDRGLGHHAGLLHEGDALVQRDKAAGDRGGAGAAIGLEDVAIDDDLALAERRHDRTTARRERPIRRWISCVRPDCLPAAASRRMRSWVERGSMPYSAVTQPLPEPSQERAAPFPPGWRCTAHGCRRI